MNDSSHKASFLFKATFFIVLLLTIGSIYENYHLWKQVKDLKDPAGLAQKRIQDTVAEVGKLIALPQEETPTIAEISDLSKLKGQEFFSKAEVGDQVLVYSVAKKAILWRPTEHKIIEVAPLGVSRPESAAAPVVSAAPTPTETPTPTPSPSPKKR